MYFLLFLWTSKTRFLNLNSSWNHWGYFPKLGLAGQHRRFWLSGPVVSTQLCIFCKSFPRWFLILLVLIWLICGIAVLMYYAFWFFKSGKRGENKLRIQKSLIYLVRVRVHVIRYTNHIHVCSLSLTFSPSLSLSFSHKIICFSNIVVSY